MALYIAFFVVSIANADQAREYELDIPRQNVEAALNELATQTGAMLLFPYDPVQPVNSNPVIGRYTVVDALEILLRDTKLTGGFTEGGVITVSRVTSFEGELEPEGEEMNVKKKAGLGAFLAAIFSVGAGAQEPADIDLAEPLLEEIIVVGTHIRGVEAVGAAKITFTREELDKTGYSTVGELMESLPQNLDEISADGVVADGASRLAGSNVQGASSISLRGLGPGSTLVLFNGKRRPGNINGRAVDVSAIPLSMVERIEIVTGGRSAVYGSDAIAGVVNIVTVTELDGAETQVYYGAPADDGGERFNFSQTFGRAFEKGGFVLGYHYSKDEALDVTDTGVLRVPSPAGVTPLPGLFGIAYESEQHVGLFAGHYELSDKVELYADAQYSADETDTGRAFNFDIPGCCSFDIGGPQITDSDQYSIAGGVRIDVGKDWQVDASGLYGVVDNTTSFTGQFVPAGTITTLDIPLENQLQDEAKLTSFSAIADGPLGEFGNGTISAAIGVDFRNESFERINVDLLAGTPTPMEDRDRDIWSIFGEVHLPLVNRNGQRLDVSLAARYDDYSDFGDTFNPQIGIEWEPLDGLTFRGSYSTSVRAPDLFTLAFANSASVQIVNDPLDPTGMTMATLFVEQGGNTDLQPEEADTYTLGIDWQPSDRTTLSLSYFNIEYEGRIDEPLGGAVGLALEDEALYGSLINRNPTPEQLAVILDRQILFFNQTALPFDPATDDPFATFSNIVLFDDRRNNIGLEAVDGLDFQATTVLEAGSGDWSFGLNGTYYFDFTRNITATSPTIEQINQPGKIVDLKLRGRIGWSRSAWNVNTYVNYVDSYDDTLAATPTEINSWTTVDLTVRYDASKITDSGFLNGVNVTLGIDNVFDEDPPAFLSTLFGLGYDAVNADPIGRFVSLRLSKMW